MALFDPILKVIGLQRLPKSSREKAQATIVQPWETLSEDGGSFISTGESPPPLRTEDYLKAARGWVYSCVAAISDEIAAINLILYKRTKKGLTEIDDHALLDLLYRVNDFTTKFDHWWLTQQYLELTGEAPWLLSRGGDGLPIAMYLLRPDKLTIKFDKENIIGSYIYEITPQHKEVFKAEDIIMLKYPNAIRPFRGKGTLEAAAETVQLDTYAEKWNVNFFYNAARPDAILSTAKAMTQTQMDRLYKQWSKKFQGIDKSAKVAILENGLEYKQMQLSQKDMDFLDQQRFSRDKIFSIFRVPKAVIAISDNVNMANAETHAYAFSRWTIKPKMIRIIEQLNEFLVPMFGDDLFLDFEDPVPENVDMKVKKYKEALGPSGYMTINEVREIEGLEEVEGGDVVYRPMAQVPAGQNPALMAPKPTPGEPVKPAKGIFLKAKPMTQKKKDMKLLKSKDRYIKAMNARVPIAKKLKGKIESTILAIVKNQLFKKKDLKDNGKSDIKKEPKQVTDLEGFWTKQIEIEEKYEKRLLARLKDIFTRQEKETIAKLEEQSKGILAKGYGDTNYTEQYWRDMKVSAPQVLLDVKKESAAMAVLSIPLLDDLIMESGQYALDALDLGIEFVHTAAVTGYLKKQPIKFATSVNKTTNLKIREQLAEGIEAGESLDKISKRISNVFSEAKGYRANSIARTEVSRATNFATVEGYKQSEVVTGKKWLTALDERTCKACNAMNGKIVSIDKNFFDKNETFQDFKFDYDAVAQPPLHVSCRCTVTPVIIE